MTKTIVEQELVTEKNKYCNHLFTHQKKYLFLLAIIVLSTPFIMSAAYDKPLFICGENDLILLTSS